MKTNNRHYILIVFSILSLVFSVISYYFIYDKTIIQAENYVNTTRNIESEDARNREQKEIIDEFKLSESDRDKIKNFFIDEDKIVDFIEEIENIGAVSKTELEMTSLNNSDGKITANISVSGLWSNTMNALVLIENLPYAIILNNINLNNRSDSEKKNSVWDLTMNIEVLTNK